MTAFKDRYYDFQVLVRELKLVREYNLGFQEGDDQTNLLFFAEASLCLVVLERFLRMVPGVEATDSDTLPNLLNKATSFSRKLLYLPDIHDQPITDQATKDRVVGLVKNFRNSVQHGNYEQLATNAGCGTKEEYFKTKFASQIETLYLITNYLVAQIDSRTGERVRNQ